MNIDFLWAAIARYLQAHPEVVDKLVDELVNALLTELSKKYPVTNRK